MARAKQKPKSKVTRIEKAKPCLIPQKLSAWLEKYVRARPFIFEMLGTLLPYQLEAVLHPARHRAVLATRRAGKSHAACVALIVAAHSRRDAVCYYLALTRASAKKIAWKVLKSLCRQYKIRAEFSESELTVTFSNGGTISLYGVNQENLLDNLRGTPIDLAVLDEAGSFRGEIVEELIEEVLEPAFSDYDGSLLMIGTPTPQLGGYFHKATTGLLPEFTLFRWDMRDNKHIAKGDPVGWLEKHRKRKGWSLDNPKYLREYCGEWTHSSDLQVYHFSREKNIGGLPDFELTHKTLAVDLGFKDDTAFVILGYNPLRSQKVWVLYTKTKSEMQLSEVARTIQNLQQQFDPHSTVIDEGGLGKSIAEDFRTRLFIPCQPAEKPQKKAYIELMNSEFHEGKIIAQKEHTHLINELINLRWDDDARKAEDPSLPNHLCDALLYGWREAYAYTHKPREETPVLTEEEKVDEWWEKEERKLQRKGQVQWWET